MFSLHWFYISLFVGWKNNWNINWIGFLELYTSRNGRVVRTYCVFNLLGSFLSPTKIGKNQFFWMKPTHSFIPLYLITQIRINFFRILFLHDQVVQNVLDLNCLHFSKNQLGNVIKDKWDKKLNALINQNPFSNMSYIAIIIQLKWKQILYH